MQIFRILRISRKVTQGEREKRERKEKKVLLIVDTTFRDRAHTRSYQFYHQGAGGNEGELYLFFDQKFEGRGHQKVQMYHIFIFVVDDFPKNFFVLFGFFNQLVFHARLLNVFIGGEEL